MLVLERRRQPQQQKPSKRSNVPKKTKNYAGASGKTKAYVEENLKNVTDDLKRRWETNVPLISIDFYDIEEMTILTNANTVTSKILTTQLCVLWINVSSISIA